MNTYRMRIYRYLPERMYGFAILEDTGQQVFFHLGSFDPGSEWKTPSYCSSCPIPDCSWAKTAPPPVAGEEVDVQVDLSEIREGTSAPRASRVIRVNIQTPIKGKMKTFDNQRGYGFFEEDNGISHYVHKSDIIGDRIPILGQVGMFFSGQRDRKTRACHVRLCR